MSQPAAAALAPLPFELVYDDGVPVEDWLHAAHMQFVPALLYQLMKEQGRDDFFIGHNTFVYYSVEQAREVADEVNNGKEERAFRGPDLFWVGGVDGRRLRHAWISWEEDGRLPDVIIELLSPSTARKDRTEKKDLYARRFRTPEYFMYEAGKKLFEGLRLVDRTYEPIPPDKHGRFWSEQLGAYLGLWHGIWRCMEADWIRLFRADGSMVPTEDELAIAARRQAVAAQRQAEEQRQRAEAECQRAEEQRQRAEAERQRAEAAEAELARLRALLAERSQGS
ncbi:MAG TPA: Uma2 family endonuclease [Thermoanaerobaculia bacterium]|nr:Uma2 family endonuclease [Thermoanaerobaculia bacterium]